MFYHNALLELFFVVIIIIANILLFIIYELNITIGIYV